MTPAQPADTVAILGQTFGVTTFPGQAHRLPAETRHLAARVLAGEYGREMANATFSLSPADDALPPELRSARAIRLIAEQAPLCIRPDERLAGSAPLLEAVFHQRPCLKERSTSHTTIGFERALREGIGGYRARIAERRERDGLSETQREFLQAMEECIDAMGVWHTRLLAGLDELGLTEVKGRLARVPEAPPQTFGEAVQALWFLWEFQRLCGNWSGLGRMDKMLGPYLARDLAEGRIDLDDARDLLAHFWIKGAEWMGAKNGQVGSSGDAQFYQNVILGGVDETGEPIVNEVTYLILDIVEELHISDFPVAVRVHSQTPDELWRRIAEVQRLGGGIVSIYNDDVVIPALVGFGYPIEEARDYTNDGCWEVLIPGRTAFGYRPFDLLPAVQKALGLDSDAEPPDDQTFETVYARFHAAMAQLLEESWDQCGDSFQTGQPSPLLSLLVDDCIERAQPYHGRGARYSVRSPHAGGMPDAANSLRAIQVLVYEQKRLTLPEFVRILRAEWEGHEELRREISRDLVLYGNDDPQADAMLRRVFDDYTALCASQPERNGVRMPAGISTFGRELQFRDGRTATPFGAKRGDILAPNLSPTPGTDRKGPTAIVNSLTKVDFTRLPCGTPLDLKLHPSAVAGKAGLTALVALLRSFVARGGILSPTRRSRRGHAARCPETPGTVPEPLRPRQRLVRAVHDVESRVAGNDHPAHRATLRRPMSTELYQLVFYVPVEHAEAVKLAVFEAGGGRIGNYDRCCWQTVGTGQFRPLPGSQPFLGSTDQLERVQEARVELVVAQAELAGVLEALIAAHPYETPAYSYWPINRRSTT